MTTLYEKIQGMKVWLIEDDEIVKESIRLHFLLNGCPFKTFGSVEEAVDFLPVESPDLVICDYQLPGLDGWRFLENLEKDHSGARKVLITAYPFDLPVADLRQAHIDALLVKPFSVQEMEEMLEQVTGTAINAKRDPAG